MTPTPSARIASPPAATLPVSSRASGGSLRASAAGVSVGTVVVVRADARNDVDAVLDEASNLWRDNLNDRRDRRIGRGALSGDVDPALMRDNLEVMVPRWRGRLEGDQQLRLELSGDALEQW